MEHTKIIIITEPYHHITYNNNMSPIKELHYKQIKTDHILGCNNILRKSNLSNNGHKLNKSGKRHLSRASINYIEQETEMGNKRKTMLASLISVGGDKCQTLANPRSAPKQVREKRNRLNIEDDLQRAQEESTETIRNITDTNVSVTVDNTNNVLYPRLSQIQLSLE
ncbi:hypothetical protein JTB14_025925 [Gonioctena quinquepunctata]|nr:hypothetical protein JTB14_025925 [Gonioctena quinquepunctata]